jgi:Mce-associated membrane protein
VVLVFLDQESRNKLRTTPRVDRNRVALTLVRTNGHWLVSEVAVL